MDKYVKEFIEENIDLIEENTTKAWEEIYRRYINTSKLNGELTTIFLSANINPLDYLDFIPDYYLYQADISAFTIPKSIKDIGICAFTGSMIEDISVPEGVTIIDDYAFDNCIYLQHVELPKSLKTMGSKVFGNCSNLKEIHYSGSKEDWWNMQRYGNWHEDSAITTVHCNDGDLKV